MASVAWDEVDATFEQLVHFHTYLPTAEEAADFAMTEMRKRLESGDKAP